jgi:hypothetical protein
LAASRRRASCRQRRLMCRIARVAAGSMSLAGSFAGCLLRSASAASSFCWQAVIFCRAPWISALFVAAAGIVGLASSFASPVSALVSAVFAAASAFLAVVQAGLAFGSHLIGGVAGEHAGPVTGHVVLEHVLLGPPAAQPAGQLGGARIEPAADGLGGHLPVLEQGQLPDRLVVVLQSARATCRTRPPRRVMVCAMGSSVVAARGARRQVSQSYPAASTSVKADGNAAPRSNTISGRLAGPGRAPAGRASVSAASAPGSVEHSAKGSPVVNAIARPARSQM